MKRIARRTFIRNAAATGAAAIAAPAVLAQETWPSRPIRFIVPLAAGGGLDFMARAVNDQLSRALGQQVFIENRTGAGGTIGIEMAIKSPPDGYSILVTNDNLVSAPHIMRLPAEYLKDLVPVIQLARQPLALAVHPSLGINSVAELIRSAKEKPGQGCATSGVGSNQHVLLEWFNKVNGVRMDHVPYRGAGQAINDLVAGHVKIAFLGPTALIPQANVGSIKIIAQSGARRSPSLPDVPTFPEAGVADVVLETWYGALVPAGTPPAVVARLNNELDKILKDPPLRERVLKTATEPVGGKPDDFAKQARADSAKYARLVTELNIHIN